MNKAINPKGIVLHCSDSPHGRGDNAQTIHEWHCARGWDGIGYHFVILEDGKIEAGRPTYWRGSHAKGHNNKIGICMIGKNDFTFNQFTSQALLVEKLMKEFDIPMHAVIGHSTFSDKTCPNYDVEDFKAKYMDAE